tara:strand:+ start:2324 stop:2461 length:138 start_codon:yes stop_codon:yes gene_type:complete
MKKSKSNYRKSNNTAGNWRGAEDKFFNKVRKGFINLLKPATKGGK